MSDSPSLYLCAHDILKVQNQCNFCTLQYQMQNDYDLLSNRINGLHANKLQQIDLNEKARKKFEGIQKQIDDVIGISVKGDMKLENEIDELKKEIKEISNYECHNRALIDAVFAEIKELDKICINNLSAWNLSDIISRLDKLEQMQKDILNAPNLIWAKYNKTPHKCPICDGLGKQLYLIAQQVQICKPCEGKGIVWS